MEQATKKLHKTFSQKQQGLLQQNLNDITVSKPKTCAPEHRPSLQVVPARTAMHREGGGVLSFCLLTACFIDAVLTACWGFLAHTAVLAVSVPAHALNLCTCTQGNEE